MIGQGSPSYRAGRCLLFVALLAYALTANHFVLAQVRRDMSDMDMDMDMNMNDMPMGMSSTLDVRLRIAWGGGKSRRWSGRIMLDRGRFSDPILLGVETNEPGSMSLRSREIGFHSPSERAYDGVDVRVRCPADARLRIEIQPTDNVRKRQKIDATISDLLKQHRSESLDRDENRILIRRSPGDTLRAVFERDSLVFGPRERFEVEFVPQHMGARKSSNYRAAIELYSSSGNRIWRKTQELRTDDQGRMPKIDKVGFKVPQAEGVYDLIATITPRRLGDNLLAPAAKWKRRVQFIVLDRQPQASANKADWQPIGSIDPDSSAWWETWKRIRRFNLLPYFRDDAIQHGKVTNRRVDNRPWIELAAGSWRAYPLPISGVGKPHVLEVEYNNSLDQSLLISILEPNAAGQVVPLTLDSGVEVTATAGSKQVAGNHRVVFWPKSKSPVLLLANRSKGPALFGRIRVLAGPQRLPQMATVEHRRTIAAYYQKPYFAENFGAAEKKDQATGRSLPDWSTFYSGADRLIQYLKFTGHNAVIMTVAADGSAIYPSSLLQPTPKFDSGIFFETGQDPVRKDVLEMLFRMFDRAGIKLIPAVQFASPLPSLEAQLRRAGQTSAGISMDYRTGQSWRARYGTVGNSALYNPLDDRVQRAMRDVVQELVRRYGKHRSFGGIHLVLSASGFAQLPSEYWACDTNTLQAFASQTGSPRSVSNVAEIFRDPKRFESWLNWRARRMAKLYGDLARITAVGPNVSLYLGSPDIWRQLRIQDLLRPSLPASRQVAQAMLRCGINVNLIDETNTVLCRPYAVVHRQPLQQQAMQLELNGSPDMDTYFGGPGHLRRTTGSLIVNSFQRLPLPSFEKISPFGEERTQLLLFPHISKSGLAARQPFVHSLATMDAQVWMHGGWLLPLGQESSLKPIIDVYRRLPAGRFEDVKPQVVDKQASHQPVVLRTRQENGRTWFYLVNDSRWPVKAAVHFSTQANLITVGSRRFPLPVPREGMLKWTLSLEPYDLVAAYFDTADVRVAKWQVEVPKRVASQLEKRIAVINSKRQHLKAPKPLVLLRNPGFEVAANRGIPNWLHAQRQGVTVRLAPHGKETPARRGNFSLHLKSDGPPAWVRSQRFQAPRTGRIFMMVWLRTSDPQQQPRLRLAVEAQIDGDRRTFYRFASVGAGTKFPLKTTWGSTPYLFPMDRLPLHDVRSLTVGFDLMGKGEVWIDDVSLYDMYFLQRERREIQNVVHNADFHRRKNNFGEADRLLNGYWSRFLEEYAGRPSSTLNIEPSKRVARRPAQNRQGDDQKKKDATIWDRVRGITPKKWFPFF